jgi:hypothetical protein
MTTVCWDGITMAADTLYVAGTRRMQGDYKKILLPEGTEWTVEGSPVLAVGFSGSIATIPQIKKCLEAGVTHGVNPDVGEYSFTVLMVTDKKDTFYWNYGLTNKGEVINELFVVEGNHGIGTGSVYGVGVMAIKGSAIDGTKAGIKIDVNSGGYIDVWSFDNPRTLRRINPDSGEIVSTEHYPSIPEKTDAILCAVNG